MPKTNNYKNPKRERLIRKLEKFKREEKAKIWGRVSEELMKNRRLRREVNLWKINKHSKENETVLIPGKVLGYGVLDHKVNVSALQFSKSAEEKIISSGGKSLSIEDLVTLNPKGSGVKILG